MQRALSGGVILGLALLALISVSTTGAQDSTVKQQVSTSYEAVTKQFTMSCTTVTVASASSCSYNGNNVDCAAATILFQATKGLKVSGYVNSSVPVTFYVMLDQDYANWIRQAQGYCGKYSIGPKALLSLGGFVPGDKAKATYSFDLTFPNNETYQFVFLNFEASSFTVRLSLVESLLVIVTSSAMNSSQVATSLASSLTAFPTSPTSSVQTTYPLATTVPPVPFGAIGLTGVIAGVAGVSSVLILVKKRKGKSKTETVESRKKPHKQESELVQQKPQPTTTRKLEEQPQRPSGSIRASISNLETRREPVKPVQPTHVKEISAASSEISASAVRPPSETARQLPQPQLPMKISTGYAGCDSLLQGGIPRRFAVVIVSPPFDERDLLLRRMIGSTLAGGQKVFFVSGDLGRTQDLTGRFNTGFIAFSPDAHRISSGMENLRDIPGIGNLVEFNILLNKGLSEAQKDDEAKLLIMDLASDVLVRYKGTMTRRWLGDFIGKRKAQNFTTICTLSPAISSKEESSRIIELFDGVIEIYEKVDQGRPRRFLAVRKMYGQEYSEAELPLERSELF